jgi:DNA-binding MarR family transcriptional regulator
MADLNETTRELTLLDEIEKDPDTTQARLADRLGVAVGTVNWLLKRMVAKGYVKVKRAQRKKLRYIITPEGLALRARLTVDYIGSSMALYRATRQKARRLLTDLRENGFSAVRIVGDGEIADVCRLTCLELGLTVAGEGSSKGERPDLPTLTIEGTKLRLEESAAI